MLVHKITKKDQIQSAIEKKRKELNELSVTNFLDSKVILQVSREIDNLHNLFEEEKRKEKGPTA
ncbi:aspartyl-phosphate phosphatase Spo0E family protein [Paenibacillus macquariensis]|uniref:Spo0E like sporulation regulatory protein n=1 Tax=Paenibacillus macquariensis TaxID=948756 RepID=A0ABY1KEZ6_9BACL|nr:aspartyl-phosphate phosphatase Spo0E family protein [Paenibacillus macquariensis]OAB29585.1 hypothetical protein PMSM_23665 [Paenibacillus macquariensis subsp. macquariensis]SIR73144.1 Spo0E like sporulation regulatory protein [Paenibacillus macquariensis]